MTTELAVAERGQLARPEQASRNPVVVYLASLGPGSRRTMAQSLAAIVQIASDGSVDAMTFPWHGLRAEHTAAIRSALADQYSPATANKMLAALRGVLKAAWRLGLVDAENYHRAADVSAVRGESLPKGRALEVGELQALFRVCAEDTSPAGRRDAALLAVLFGAGMRRAEVVALDVGDFDADTGAITIRSGKGNKARIAYATNGAKSALDDWITSRGDADGPLFVPVNKGGAVHLGQRITAQAVYAVMRKRATDAKVEQFSPHDLRRTFIGNLLDAGADVSMVQRLAGHSNVSTTMLYDRRPERTKRKAAELLHVPYQRPAEAA